MIKEFPDEKKRARIIIGILRKLYPAVKTALNHSSPLEILVATILSAQCTDRQVNIVTSKLFQKYKTANDFANANHTDLERIIKSTGFYRVKSRNLIACCRALLKRHRGIVPQMIEELVLLPGVGRKTANVVLGNYFGKAVGIVVDTHVKRIAVRLGFTMNMDPEKIELDLMQIIPKKHWIDFGNILIQHGRKTCKARKPMCDLCPIKKYCPARQQ